MRRCAILLAAFSLLAGCGSSGSSSSGSSSTTRRTTDTGTTTPPTSHRSTTASPTAPVGAVDAIHPSGGTVDRSTASRGTPLRSGSLLETNARGTIDFHLNEKLSSCRALESSQAKIRPTANVLIGFETGTFLCGTSASGSLAMFTGGAAQQFYSHDPVFVVVVHTDGSIRLEVIQGFLATTAPDGSVTVIGSGEAGDLAAGQAPLISSIDYTTLPEGAIGFLTDLVPSNPLEYPTPETSLSPTLARVIDRGALRVAVTSPSDQPAVLDFTRRLVSGEFAHQWDKPRVIETVVSNLTPAEAAKLLDAGEVDLVVTDAPPAGQWTPLVQDDNGQIWYLTHDPADTELARVLAASMRVVLAATCTSSDSALTYAAPNPSCYEQARQELFTQPATTPFSLFAQLLGLQTP
jgi:hypothetical protein